MILDNFVVRWLIEKEANKMFAKLFAAVEGSKTYILAALGIVVALIGHFWGPIHLMNGIDIPALAWGDVWNIIWNGGLIAALRHGISTSTSNP